MPFCTSCGTEVPVRASFCGHCGLAQPISTASGAPAAGPRPVSSSALFANVSPRTASILCYIPVFGVIPAIIVLASQRYRRNILVRFNAFQSVYLFVAWLIVSTAMPIFSVGMGRNHIEGLLFVLMKLAFLVCWIFLLTKATQEEQVHLPIVGDLAARSANEQL